MKVNIKKNRIRTAILFMAFASFILIGCAGDPVLFNESVSGVDDNVIYRVYFDREGYIYPQSRGKNAVLINSSDFNAGPQKGHLQRYFCEYSNQLQLVADQAGVSTPKQADCSISEDAVEGRNRAINYGVSDLQDNWLDQWQRIQEGILDKQSQSIYELLQQEENIDRPLFVLIHGYNNSLSSIQSNYDDVRYALRSSDKYKKEKFVFLEIYWDGAVQTLPFNIWAGAQYTGPKVGARLRKLLKLVEPSRPVRILTHSSGAFVAGNLVADTRKALMDWTKEGVCTPDHENYDQAVCHHKRVMMSTSSDKSFKDYRVLKSSDVRIGMIAPATSAWTFTGGDAPNLEVGRGILQPSGKLRLIFGQHEDDYANTKLLGLEMKNGVTTLGVRKSSYCEIQKHIVNNKAKNLSNAVDIFRVDFKSKDKEPYPKMFFRADHGLNSYLNREKAPDFFTLFLGDYQAKDLSRFGTICL